MRDPCHIVGIYNSVPIVPGKRTNGIQYRYAGYPFAITYRNPIAGYQLSLHLIAVLITFDKCQVIIGHLTQADGSLMGNAFDDNGIVKIVCRCLCGHTTAQKQGKSPKYPLFFHDFLLLFNDFCPTIMPRFVSDAEPIHTRGYAFQPFHRVQTTGCDLMAVNGYAAHIVHDQKCGRGRSDPR